MRVQIPEALREYSNGQAVVEAEGANVRRLIEALEESCPGIKAALVAGDRLRPGIAVAVDGRISQFGILEQLQHARDVTFVPAITGG